MVSINIENPLAFSVGLLGNILSFLVIMAPMATFYKVYKKKSTGSFQSAPYVIALSSGLLWVYYAFLTKNTLLLSINMSSCVLESAYLAIFIFYASKNDKVSTLKMMFFFNLGMTGFVLFITLTFLNGKKRIEITGWICASFAISVFVAPLSIIRLIIRTKSVKYMPFSLSFFLTLSAVAWFFYGLLIKDYFVALPNVMGFGFGIAQIVLYLMYMNVKKDISEQHISGQATEVEFTKSSDLELQMAADNCIKEPETIKKVMPAEVKSEA